MNLRHSYLVHFSGKEMDSKTVTVTAPVNGPGSLFDSGCLAGRERAYWR
jgi:hypothetical protein